jgi:hypothetical protein
VAYLFVLRYLREKKAVVGIGFDKGKGGCPGVIARGDKSQQRETRRMEAKTASLRCTGLLLEVLQGWESHVLVCLVEGKNARYLLPVYLSQLLVCALEWWEIAEVGTDMCMLMRKRRGYISPFPLL